jgi:hypothetical protein
MQRGIRFGSLHAPRAQAAALALLAFASVTVRATDAAPAASPVAEGRGSAEDKSAADLVRRYFAAYQRRDQGALEALFDKDARIVRHYGQQIDVPALLKGVSALPKPASDEEYIVGNFELLDSAPVTVVAFDLQAATDATGEPAASTGDTPGSSKFRASWILRQTPAGPRIAWATDVPVGLGMQAMAIHPASPVRARPALGPADEPAMRFVEHFFDLFVSVNERETMKQLFLPHAKLVHMEGTEQSVDDMVQMMDKQPPQPSNLSRPKPPPFDHITVRHWGDTELIAFDNHVTHWHDGDPNIEHAFRENWLLKQTPDGLKALWVSYSMYGAVPIRAAKSATH